MPTLMDDCPRCRTKKITFDVKGKSSAKKIYGTADWQDNYEVFCRCRHCGKTTIFVLALENYSSRGNIAKDEYWKSSANLNNDFEVCSFVSVKDFSPLTPPDHLPAPVHGAFAEGAACLSIACYNAAAAMFRLSIDLTTKGFLPVEETGVEPTRRQRRELAARLDWLFGQGILSQDLKDLASCVREDGNDAAHDGTLLKEDAEDLADFAVALLTRIYTEPAKLDEARARRENRRKALGD